MSIKMQGGLKLTSPIENFFESVDKIRQVASSVFFEKFFETLPEDTEDYEHWNTVQKAFTSPSWDYLDQNNFGYRITFLTGGLVMIHSAVKDYRSALIASGIMENYEFWDNTDWPEGVDAAEWNEREKAWETAIDESSFGTDRGVFLEHPTRMDTCLKNIEIRNKTIITKKRT